MNNRTIGTCSICGGPVVVATITWSTVPPSPHCARCHAVPVAAYGPVIPMRGFYDCSGSTADVVEALKEKP